jgi:hypothetical protein
VNEPIGISTSLHPSCGVEVQGGSRFPIGSSEPLARRIGRPSRRRDFEAGERLGGGCRQLASILPRRRYGVSSTCETNRLVRGGDRHAVVGRGPGEALAAGGPAQADARRRHARRRGPRPERLAAGPERRAPSPGDAQHRAPAARRAQPLRVRPVTGRRPAGGGRRAAGLAGPWPDQHGARPVPDELDAAGRLRAHARPLAPRRQGELHPPGGLSPARRQPARPALPGLGPAERAVDGGDQPDGHISARSEGPVAAPEITAAARTVL